MFFQLYFCLVFGVNLVFGDNSHTLQIETSKNISIKPGQFYMLKLSIKQISDPMNLGNSLQIQKSMFDSSQFDVFMLTDQSDIDCYLQIYYNSSWDQTCSFLYQTQSTYLKRQNFNQSNTQINLDENKTYQIIIDNTYFPSNGAYFNDPLYLDITFQENVTPITKIMDWLIRILILEVCLFISLLVWFVVYFCKYRNQQKISQNQKHQQFNESKKTRIFKDKQKKYK